MQKQEYFIANDETPHNNFIFFVDSSESGDDNLHRQWSKCNAIDWRKKKIVDVIVIRTQHAQEIGISKIQIYGEWRRNKSRTRASCAPNGCSHFLLFDDSFWFEWDSNLIKNWNIYLLVVKWISFNFGRPTMFGSSKAIKSETKTKRNNKFPHILRSRIIRRTRYNQYFLDITTTVGSRSRPMTVRAPLSVCAYNVFDIRIYLIQNQLVAPHAFDQWTGRTKSVTHSFSYNDHIMSNGE